LFQDFPEIEPNLKDFLSKMLKIEERYRISWFFKKEFLKDFYFSFLLFFRMEVFQNFFLENLNKFKHLIIKIFDHPYFKENEESKEKLDNKMKIA